MGLLRLSGTSEASARGATLEKRTQSGAVGTAGPCSLPGAGSRVGVGPG